MSSQGDDGWTAADYRTLKRLWPDTKLIADRIGQPENAVKVVARGLGYRLKSSYTPCPKIWTAIATQEAHRDGLDPVALLAGAVRKGYPEARWRAWRRVLDASPHYTIAGVGRASGHHWATVLYGLKRLKGIPAEACTRGTYYSRKPKVPYVELDPPETWQ